MCSFDSLKMIHSYLSKIKQLDLNLLKNVHIVIGNEASDLDSIASSICYAEFLSRVSKSNYYIPVMNIPVDDFRLRTETSWFFRKLEIDPSNLLFWNDITHIRDFSLILVDHNRLSGTQQVYIDNGYANVFEIIDHHEDEKRYTVEKRIIEPVGSTCTLIAEIILKTEIPSLDVAILLLGTILIDTQNLDINFKAKDKDIEIGKKLMKICSFSEQERDDLYCNLVKERFSVDSLSSQDLLRADYKEYFTNGVKYGISSVKLGYDDCVAKDTLFPTEIIQFRKTNHLDLFIVMTASLKFDKFERSLVVCCLDLRESLEKYLCLSDIHLIEVKRHEEITVYQQKNIQASRKQVQPLIDLFLKESK